MTIEIDLGDIHMDEIGKLLLHTHATAFAQGYNAGQRIESTTDFLAELCANNKCPYNRHTCTPQPTPTVEPPADELNWGIPDDLIPGGYNDGGDMAAAGL